MTAHSTPVFVSGNIRCIAHSVSCASPSAAQSSRLASPLSPPLRIDAVNVFPPGAPKGLAAVATKDENGSGPAIDLSWLPGAEADLAGYIVYRRDVGTSSAALAWQRISPAQPVVGPGYHDPNVQPGHTYAYSVTAIDQQDHESARSAEHRTPSLAPSSRISSSRIIKESPP